MQQWADEEDTLLGGSGGLSKWVNNPYNPGYLEALGFRVGGSGGLSK